MDSGGLSGSQWCISVMQFTGSFGIRERLLKVYDGLINVDNPEARIIRVSDS